MASVLSLSGRCKQLLNSPIGCALSHGVWNKPWTSRPPPPPPPPWQAELHHHLPRHRILRRHSLCMPVQWKHTQPTSRRAVPCSNVTPTFFLVAVSCETSESLHNDRQPIPANLHCDPVYKLSGLTKWQLITFVGNEICQHDCCTTLYLAAFCCFCR